MYPNEYDAIRYFDVVGRIPPNVNGYQATISEVKVIEKNNQKLPLLTLTGTANNVNFELTKFLKYELRTGSVLYTLFKAIHKLPQKGEYAYISDLIGSLVQIYVEDRLDNEGNTISYVKKIEPYNRAYEPIIPQNHDLKNPSHNDEQDLDEDDYEDVEYDEDEDEDEDYEDVECEEDEDYEDVEENSSGDRAQEKSFAHTNRVNPPARSPLKSLPQPIAKPRAQRLPQPATE